MKVLNKDELQIAEGVLLKYLPKSLQVYGFIFGINREKPSTVEVIVDTWPDFRVIICRPDLKNKHTLEFEKYVTFYSMDEQILRKMLREETAIDWSTYFIIAGCDSSHAPMLKEVSSHRKVNNRWLGMCHVMYLPDSSHLLTPAVHSELESRISSLNRSHIDLVNNTWKYGGSEQSCIKVTHMISNFPSFCITDGQGQPVSWILVYDNCAFGILYTLPEHRRRGYASALVSTLAKRLHAEGHPVYCLVDEDSEASYRLCKKLGFIEDPSYRVSWFDFNF